MDEDIKTLFAEYSDLLHYEGYTAQIKTEQPNRYAQELAQFQDAHIVFPLTFNFINHD